MKIHRYTRSSAPDALDGEMEIDVTPIMNMFVILIPFLVSMAVFTHLAIIRFSLPSNASAQLEDLSGKPTPKLTVVVSQKYLALTHGETLLDSLSVADGRFQEADFVKKLTSLRIGRGLGEEVIIASHDTVVFERVVAVMDYCSEAGFTKIGLSEGTVDPAKGI